MNGYTHAGCKGAKTEPHTAYNDRDTSRTICRTCPCLHIIIPLLPLLPHSHAQAQEHQPMGRTIGVRRAYGIRYP